MDRLSTDNLIVASWTLVFVVSDQTPRTHACFNLLTNGYVDSNFRRIVPHVGAIHAHQHISSVRTCSILWTIQNINRVLTHLRNELAHHWTYNIELPAILQGCVL